MNLKNEKGFNLIEVVIAAAILGIALLAIFEIFPASYSEIAYAGRQSKAVYLARDLAETLKALPYDDPKLDVRPHADTVWVDTDNNPDTSPDTYYREWIVTTIDTTTGIKGIEINVEWRGRNTVKTYKLRTRRAKYTIG